MESGSNNTAEIIDLFRYEDREHYISLFLCSQFLPQNIYLFLGLECTTALLTDSYYYSSCRSIKSKYFMKYSTFSAFLYNISFAYSLH